MKAPQQKIDALYAEIEQHAESQRHSGIAKRNEIRDLCKEHGISFADVYHV